MSHLPSSVEVFAELTDESRIDESTGGEMSETAEVQTAKRRGRPRLDKPGIG